MVEQGKFRADLLDRLSFDVITLPPLRFREDDIPLLSDFFATGMIKELKRDFFPGFTDESMHHLVNYAWPGNLRELKNVIERAVYRCQIDTPIDHIDFDPFESPFRPLHNDSTHQADETIVEQEVEVKQEEVKKRDIESLPHDFKAYIQQHEIELLQRALDKYRFNQRKTADALGLSYHQIRAYLRKYPSINSKID